MKIAVICAPQTFGCNTGMFSVDWAAWYFLQKHFPTAEARFFTLYPHRCAFGAIPFVYEGRAAFYAWESECDVILYWGDFLHGLSYRNAVVNWLEKLEAGMDRASAQQEVRRFLYQSEASTASLQKVILYGGTILFNHWNVYTDTVYANDLSRLVQGAKAVWMREPFSAAAVQDLLGSYRSTAQGTDCALLLDEQAFPEASDAILSPALLTTQIGVFLGRGHFNIDWVVGLLVDLEQGLVGECVWLDWGKEPFFLDKAADYRDRLPEMKTVPSPGSAPVEVLSALRSFAVVVSDTYHVCVNAWNLGIPAICLIDDLGTSLGVNNGGSVGRDKRVVFYWSYNLSPFLVYASEVADEKLLQARTDGLMRALMDKDSLALAMTAMRRHAAAGEGQLIDALSQSDRYTKVMN